VTVRLRETDGRPAVARLRIAGGIESARLGDLLEERDGASPDSAVPDSAVPDGAAQAGVGAPALVVSDGVAHVPVGPFETVTLRVRLRPATGTGTDPAAPAELPEPAQPVYTRYWLHGKGPAPAGNMPVAVHFSPARVTLGGADPADPAPLALTVAAGPAGGSGQVEILVPGVLTAKVKRAADSADSADLALADLAAAQDGLVLTYDLAPNGFAAWDVTVTASPGTANGRYFVTARITDALGQVLEDTALVTVGEPGAPEPDLEPEELFSRLQSDLTALAEEADLEILTPAVRLAPGERGELAVRVSSRLASQLRGEVQLVSPIGTWQTTGPWTQPVTVEPGGATTLRFGVAVPAIAEPGWEQWLLVKLMYFGRVRYSESVPLIVT
jgi:hypothetical protein